MSAQTSLPAGCDPAWFDSVAPLAMAAWRGVEAQHVVSTLSLVDTREEHEALEALLEGSKPPLPPTAASLPYLLGTPFRYLSPSASRFRRGGEPGIWHGAGTLHAACAEVAWWRLRFVLDSAGLSQARLPLLTEHTFFCATVSGNALDLTRPPWDALSAVWAHPQDYAGTQALAAAARAQPVGWIRYASVRDPGAQCAAVLQPAALAHGKPRQQQVWHCKATRDGVLFHQGDTGTTWSWEA